MEFCRLTGGGPERADRYADPDSLARVYASILVDAYINRVGLRSKAVPRRSAFSRPADINCATNGGPLFLRAHVDKGGPTKMDPIIQLILVGVGLLMLVIGVTGGDFGAAAFKLPVGFELQGLAVPKVAGLPRLASGVVGIGLIGLALYSTMVKLPAVPPIESTGPIEPAGHATVLYQKSDWSNPAGWGAGPDWQVASRLLVNDASAGGTSLILSPYEAGVADYAVEAEIQSVTQDDSNAGFGLAVRWAQDGGYRATVVQQGRVAIEQGDLTPGRRIGLPASFRHGGSWHTYRLEAKGTKIRFLIDGNLLIEQDDDRYVTGARSGLWAWKSRINVRSFRVLAQ
jgi:hypothetical protein